ncbi:MAG TPA: hypothetical protein VJQ61_08130 [Sinomonas sp.]|nr:hypothetical protein [Sinomonas sp.]
MFESIGSVEFGGMEFGRVEVIRAWQRSGNPAPDHRLDLYAQALSARGPIGAYTALNDVQEDSAILALYRVDRPQATIADLHQMPPLALSCYHQLLHDLARQGLGPIESMGGLR